MVPSSPRSRLSRQRARRRGPEKVELPLRLKSPSSRVPYRLVQQNTGPAGTQHHAVMLPAGAGLGIQIDHRLMHRLGGANLAALLSGK